MFHFDYLKKTPYQNPYAGTLIGLIGGADRARAASAEAVGQINANESNQITGQVGGTLNMLLQHELKKQDPQYKLEQAKLNQVNQDQADDKTIRLALANNGGDLESALKDVRSQGAVGVTAAGKLENQILTQRKEAQAAQKDELGKLDDGLKRTGMQIDLASRLLRSVPDPVVDPDTGVATPHPDAPAAYAAIAPKLKQLLGPQLGDKIPDQYDPETTTRMKALGETTQETLARQRLAVDAATKALDAGKDKRAKDGYFTKALGLGLSTAENQDEWDKQIQSAGALGADPATIAKFPTTFTPEGAKKALTMAVSPDELAKLNAPKPAKTIEPGTVEAFATAYAKDKKMPVDMLSAKDNLVIARQWAQAHREDKPEDLTPTNRKAMIDTIVQYPSVYNDLTDTLKGKLAPDLAAAGFTGFGAPSKATTAGAERWRANQMALLEKDVASGKAALSAEVTPEDYAKRKATIDASYRVQIGAAGTPAIPQTPERTPAPGTAPVAPVTPPAAPAANPKMAAVKAKSPGVDDAVLNVLAGKPAGRYTGKDGRVFIVGTDGSIKPGK